MKDRTKYFLGAMLAITGVVIFLYGVDALPVNGVIKLLILFGALLMAGAYRVIVERVNKNEKI